MELPEITFKPIAVPPGPVDIDIHFPDWTFPTDRICELESLIKQETSLLEATISKTGLGVDGMLILEGLAKSVNTLRRYVGLQKLTSIADIIAMELSENLYEKIAIFAIHRGVIETLRLRLKKYGVVTQYAGTPSDKRDFHVAKFQTNPHTRVFIGNISAAGTAIELTASNQVAFAECSWDPKQLAQATMRCHKQGQMNPVTVRFFSLSNSVDERICERLMQKTRSLVKNF